MTKRFIGYIDYGVGENNTDEATDAIVFMVVSIFGHWKQPIGYFFTHGLPGYILSRLIVQAIELLHDHNVSVVTVTMDGHQANQAAFKQLGVKLKGTIDSAFQHPSDSNQKILEMLSMHTVRQII